MSRKKKHPEHVNHERWLVSYADFITLLFAFFVVMFSVSQVDSKKAGRFTESFKEALQWEGLPGGHGILPDKRPGDSPLKPLTTPLDKGASSPRATEGEKMRKAFERRAKKTPALAGLQIVDMHGELIIRLPERLMFDLGDARLRDEGKAAIGEIADEVAPRELNIRIEGHTDPAPIRTYQFPSNWELSTARATAVVRSLIDTTKITPDRISAAGYAEFHPIATNDTPEGRAQNRRVDLVLVTPHQEPTP